MTLWLIIAAMTVVALAVVVVPLVRARRAPTDRAEYDLAIYRDQLAEVTRDSERGMLAPAEAEAARLEIERRMLAAADTAPQSPGDAPPAAPRHRWRLAAALAILVPAIAVPAYLDIGAPDLAMRPARIASSADPQRAETERLVAELARKMEDRPNDVRGWSLLGRSLAGLGRFREAEQAYAKAVAAKPDDSNLWALRAEVLIAAEGGQVTPAARAMLDEALKRNRDEWRARYYVGLADRQSGRTEQALEAWLALERDSPEGAPWLTVLGQRIDELASELGRDPAALARRAPAPASPASPASPGPTDDDVAAASQMSATDRAAMIRGMVDRLAARMEEEPDNVEGWQRLGRAWQVLGEIEKSRHAYGRAVKLLPEGSDKRRELERLIEALGKTGTRR